ATHAAPGNAAPPDPAGQRVTWDGKAVVTTQAGQEVYRYVPPAPQTYLAPPPLVVDLGGQRRILVREASGKYLLCSPDGKQVRTFIERPYERHMVHVVPAGAGPGACDVDGGGENGGAARGPRALRVLRRAPAAVRRRRADGGLRLRRRRGGRLDRRLGELLRHHQRGGEPRPGRSGCPLRRCPRPLDGGHLSLA